MQPILFACGTTQVGARTLLHEFQGESVSDLFGMSIGARGDLNGDGHPDIVAGGYRNVGLQGVVRVFSGADGSELLRIDGAPNQGLGSAVDFAGDIDGDGHDDFIAAGDPSAALISGRTGCIIARFQSVETQGYVVAFAGDTDLDGKPDFVLGELLFHSPDFGGRVGVFSYDGMIGSNYCIATANSTGDPALMIASGSASVSANDLPFSAGPIAVGQPGIFYYGPAQSQLPFGNGFRCVAPGATGVFRLPVAVTGSGGCLSHDLEMNAPPGPAGLITAGSNWNFQTWYRDPAGGGSGFDLSDGLEIDFTP